MQFHATKLVKLVGEKGIVSAGCDVVVAATCNSGCSNGSFYQAVAAAVVRCDGNMPIFPDATIAEISFGI